MIEIDYANSKISDFIDLQEKLIKIRDNIAPDFFVHIIDLNLIKNLKKKYSQYENIILIGRGGSTSSFEAIFRSLKEFDSDKKIFIIKTLDLDYIQFVKKQCPKKNSIVIVISKSGNTVDVNENFFQFQEYKIITITTPNNNVLHKISTQLKLESIPHPEIGGRFTGGTEVAL
ncbi:MAG: hypothetical protein Q7K42_03545, partial [Candidatus Diapherotrites archaeon]|nr:hypothetical protein [Candidatus Diapherotrites archaeon]